MDFINYATRDVVRIKQRDQLIRDDPSYGGAPRAPFGMLGTWLESPVEISVGCFHDEQRQHTSYFFSHVSRSCSARWTWRSKCSALTLTFLAFSFFPLPFF